MCFSSETWCGRCLLLFFCLLTVFSFWVFMSVDYVELLEEEEIEESPPIVLENDRLPLLSPDRKTIYVISEEGLPIANNFILRNPSIPIQKIVYRKPGVNNSIHVYPIQREALVATNRTFTQADIPGLCAFLFMLIFTSVGIYILLCREMCGCRCSTRPRSSSVCDTCFEFDPAVDFADLDDFFDSPDSTPGNSPIKQKKGGGESVVKIPITDELKQPLLLIV
ncbi:uncharacterized protein LOC118436509 [Folsomia candida]|uniref:Uncharacterized protein n=1 Tax=Folsomia candida TaxID=158441 RepID=A0A226DY16_FOLCA|nr:uncharacterized protein LOC118436509 [Folsomia candida]OXA50119.1 hypothetical protein Fcan01_15303 [Folsomia candida]